MTTEMTTEMTTQSYEDQGFQAPIRVMSAEAAAALHARMEAFRREHPDDFAFAFNANCQYLFPWLFDLTLNDTVLDAVEQVIGPNILVWSAMFFAKDPGDGKFVSWHQDSTYWGLEPPDIVTAWIALTPSTPESGCMRVVPGSHQWGQLGHADTFGDDNLLSRGQEIAVDVSEDQAHDVVLQPGEMSLHHVRIVHGSNPNTSTLPRVGFAIRYIPTYCHQANGRTFAVLARGKDEFGNFEPGRRPDADYDDASRAFHRKVLASVNAILMADAASDSHSPGHRVMAES